PTASNVPVPDGGVRVSPPASTHRARAVGPSVEPSVDRLPRPPLDPKAIASHGLRECRATVDAGRARYRFGRQLGIVPLTGTQAGGRSTGEGAGGGENDAVVALGGFARNQPVREVERHLLGVALGRVSKAAAARQFEADEIAAGDALPPLGTDRLARNQ